MVFWRRQRSGLKPLGHRAGRAVPHQHDTDRNQILADQRGFELAGVAGEAVGGESIGMRAEPVLPVA
jgi:hypothetical protein